MEAQKPGRKRSETARQAILDATLAIASRQGYGELTMEGIAAKAGVGKQTIYRWWQSRREVVLETLAHRAAAQIANADHGSLRKDLSAFLVATFRALAEPGVADLLRGLVAEAQLDRAFRQELAQTFIAARRDALRAIFLRALDRGEVRTSANVEVGLDIVFGVMWYRLLLEHAPLDDAAARALARVAEQAVA